MSNSLTDGCNSVVSDLSSFDDDGDGSLVSFVGLLSAVVSSSATLAKKRVPPDLSLSSAAAKSAMLLLLLCRANDDDDADKVVVLCVGRVNPHDELMSSAEADKNSAADAEGLDEAVIATIVISFGRSVAAA